MMSKVSDVSKELFLLEGLADFQGYAVQLVQQTQRSLAILSHELDPQVYATDELVQAISDFARSSRYAQVQILVKNTKPLAEAGHKLAKLHQRLSTKIMLRKMTIEPDDTEMAFMLCDTSALLFQNDEANYRGFANLDAAVEVKRFRDIFDYLWQYGEPEPELQVLHL